MVLLNLYQKLYKLKIYLSDGLYNEVRHLEK